MIPPEAKILNLNVKLSDGPILKLQAAGRQELLHNAICGYLKRAITDENIATFQKAINAKVSQQLEFEEFQFISDQRIYELLIGETIVGIMQKTKSADIAVRFAWQKK